MLGRRSPRQGILPPGRYFATLGEVAKNYGGMTNVVFHRSRAFAAVAGVPVEVLTFGPERDYRRLTREMISDGRLVRGVEIRNLWADLEALTPKQLRSWPAGPVPPQMFRPLTRHTAERTVNGPGVATRRYRYADDGKTVLQVDYLRRNGRLLVSDRRDTQRYGTKGGQLLVLCDRHGEPVGTLGSTAALQTAWLDHVIGDDPAFMFSDSFGVAAFTHTYKRPNVVVIQTFHNRHLAVDDAQESPYGMVQKRYLGFLGNIDDFDATIFLSERQRADVDALFGPSPQRYVMPNSRDIEPLDRAPQRDRRRGAILARLVPNKQLDHAARAVATVNGSGSSPVTLDVYGDGSDRDRIEGVVAELGLGDHFVLHGHDPLARAAFGGASFSLLTSSSEGFGLVLVESMGYGCIPIAYDIRYGPREIITDGVDGFLVPRGDVDAVADRIRRLTEMDEDELSAMRAAARRRAEQLSDASVTRVWADLLRRLREAKRPPEPLAITADAVEADLDGAGNLNLHFTVRPDRTLAEPRVFVVLSGRRDPVLARALATGSARPDRSWAMTAVVPRALYAWQPPGLVDVSCDVYDAAGRGTCRLPAPARFVAGERITLDDRLDLYATKYGNLSMKRTPAPQSA